jgi:hypothetical protein
MRDEFRRDEFRRDEFRRDEFRRDEFRRDEFRRGDLWTMGEGLGNIEAMRMIVDRWT